MEHNCEKMMQPKCAKAQLFEFGTSIQSLDWCPPSLALSPAKSVDFTPCSNLPIPAEGYNDSPQS